MLLRLGQCAGMTPERPHANGGSMPAVLPVTQTFAANPLTLSLWADSSTLTGERSSTRA
jgi:hypothetical protein